MASSRSTSVPGNGGKTVPHTKNDVKPSLISNTREFSNSNRVDVAHTVISTSSGVEAIKKGEGGSPTSRCFSELSSSEYLKKNRKNDTPLNTCHVTTESSKSVHSPSKVNENTTGAGVLRYALHLRFLCTPPKKSLRSVQRCKSDPFSVPAKSEMDIDVGERRFYLYNDLRVVFPQRHSDADEGKVFAELLTFTSFNIYQVMGLLSC